MSGENTYLDRAWKDLTSDEGWWKSIFAFGIINCVPIFGQIIMFGYLSDWAKEAAWGMRTSLSRQLGDIGRRVKYGFMSLWVIILWIAPLLIIAWLMSFIPVAGGALCFTMQIISIVMIAPATAGALRCIIYEHVMPGLQIRRIFRMVRRDPVGLAQSYVIFLLVIPLALAALFIVLLPTIPFVGIIASATPSSILGSDLARVVFFGMLTMVVSFIVWVIGAIVSALISAMYMRSMGYWIEQFEPAKWRSPTTPMPFEIEMEAEKARKAEEAKRAKEEKKARKNKPQAPEEPKEEPVEAEIKEENAEEPKEETKEEQKEEG